MATTVTTWPAAAGTQTDAYTVKANGMGIPVMGVPMPENRLAEDLRHPYSFALFDADGEVTVEVSSRFFDMGEVKILPDSAGARLIETKGNTAVFRATPPFTLAVEPCGRHNALILAANTPETDVPREDDEGVIFFGPGRHHPGVIRLSAGQTLYLAGGAWVEGAVTAFGDGIRICGRGVLSGAPWPWVNGPVIAKDEHYAINRSGQMVRLEGRGIGVRDVALLSSWGWCLVLNEVENAEIENVKILGGRVINDDGIDICRSRNVTIRDCFIRAQDDCISPKWWCENLLAERCTLWADVANPFRIGYECEDAPFAYRNLTFRDIDILHMTLQPTTPDIYWSHAAIHIQPANGQMLENFTFERLRFHEVCDHHTFLILKTMATETMKKSSEAGYFRNLVLRDIHLPESGGGMGVYLSTKDDAHFIDGVTFDNVDGYGNVVVAGAVKNTAGVAPHARTAYGPLIGDRLWMWGHHAHSTDDGIFGIPTGNTIDMADACKAMGIPNCAIVRWRNMPDAAALDDYMAQFHDTRRIAFSVTDGAKETFEEKVGMGLELARKHPNLTMFFLDDFFVSSCELTQPVGKIRDLRGKLASRGLKLAIVLYADQDGVKPEFKEYLDLCDEISFWFWNGKNVTTIEGEVAKLRALIGKAKPVLLGIYMWDFGARKPMAPELMETQLASAYKLLKSGAIQGLVFHCTPIVDRGLEAVEIARRWIAEHAGEKAAD